MMEGNTKMRFESDLKKASAFLNGIFIPKNAKVLGVVYLEEPNNETGALVRFDSGRYFIGNSRVLKAIDHRSAERAVKRHKLTETRSGRENDEIKHQMVRVLLTHNLLEDSERNRGIVKRAVHALFPEHADYFDKTETDYVDMLSGLIDLVSLGLDI